MNTEYQVQIFGKPDCPKCKVLNDRVDKILDDDDWADFEKKKFNLDTEEGLIAFSLTECINPQRIPALVIASRNDEDETFEIMTNRHPGKKDEVCKKSKLYQYLGIQTDYENGGGVINPRMITSIFNEARA